MTATECSSSCSRTLIQSKACVKLLFKAEKSTRSVLMNIWGHDQTIQARAKSEKGFDISQVADTPAATPKPRKCATKPETTGSNEDEESPTERTKRELAPKAKKPKGSAVTVEHCL